MIAIVTGDLVQSAEVETTLWMQTLRGFLNKVGKSPTTWEIFRGDSFQFKCQAPDAFRQFLLLKSAIKQIQGLDVRASIGLGEIEFKAKKLTESNGSAFIRSGRAFDQMKEKQLLVFSTGDEALDKTLNLFAQFASHIMDNWSVAAAEAVDIALKNPQLSQQQIAQKLKTNQSAVSQNRKRAQLDLLLELNEYYTTSVTSLSK